jgi:hypothetical protein
VPSVLSSSVQVPARCLALIASLSIIWSCTFLSNKDYVQQHPDYAGITKVAIFLQKWPVYLQLPNQNNLGMEFIRKSTLFAGPWEPADRINPRAVDVQDIDDKLMAHLLRTVLTQKGYQPYVMGIIPSSPGPMTVAQIIAECQAVNPEMDAMLFCFYSPTAYFAKARATPPEHNRWSYGLQQIIHMLNPGGNNVTWAGPRSALAPANSISHAFIYVSLTMFRAWDWQPLWEVANSEVGGALRPRLSDCPPAPTDENYPADAAMILRLMCSNLTCRLNHLIPYAFWDTPKK